MPLAILHGGPRWPANIHTLEKVGFASQSIQATVAKSSDVRRPGDTGQQWLLGSRGYTVVPAWLPTLRVWADMLLPGVVL